MFSFYGGGGVLACHNSKQSICTAVGLVVRRSINADGRPAIVCEQSRKHSRSQATELATFVMVRLGRAVCLLESYTPASYSPAVSRATCTYYYPYILGGASKQGEETKQQGREERKEGRKHAKMRRKSEDLERRRKTTKSFETAKLTCTSTDTFQMLKA